MLVTLLVTFFVTVSFCNQFARQFLTQMSFRNKTPKQIWTQDTAKVVTNTII